MADNKVGWRGIDKIRNICFTQKKELLKNDFEYEIIMIDATETLIEKPKKNKEITIREKRKNIP